MKKEKEILKEKKRQEDLAILNGYWLYRDDLITLDIFLELINKSKDKYKESEQNENT